MAKNDSKGKQDGSWEWYLERRNAKILEAIAEFNEATRKISLTHNGSFTEGRRKQPTVITCQFSTIPREGGSKAKQFKLGLGNCDWSMSGLELAKQRAGKISLKLIHNEFHWQWFDEYIKGHKPVDEIAVLLSYPVQHWIDKLYATKKKQISERSWYNAYLNYYNRFYPPVQRGKDESLADFNARKAALSAEYRQKPLSEKLIRNCFDNTKAHTRARATCYQVIRTLLKTADLQDHFKKLLAEYKITTIYKESQRNVPNDHRIKEVYYTAFQIKSSCQKRYRHTYRQWQWLYGLLATYGLRIHEAWNIANWDKAVYLKGNDWVKINETEHAINLPANTIIPAFNSPENDMHVLAIGNQTKTGYRLAYPLSPAGEDWVKEFDLMGEFRLPEVKNPLGAKSANGSLSMNCTIQTCEKFRDYELGFTPHDLRHAFNHRGRLLKIDVPALAASLGHSEGMNAGTYAKHMVLETKNTLLQNSFGAVIKSKPIVNLSLDESIALAIELANGNQDKLLTTNQLLAAQYGVVNPLKL